LKSFSPEDKSFHPSHTILQTPKFCAVHICQQQKEEIWRGKRAVMTMDLAPQNFCYVL